MPKRQSRYSSQRWSFRPSTQSTPTMTFVSWIWSTHFNCMRRGRKMRSCSDHILLYFWKMNLFPFPRNNEARKEGGKPVYGLVLVTHLLRFQFQTGNVNNDRTWVKRIDFCVCALDFGCAVSLGFFLLCWVNSALLPVLIDEKFACWSRTFTRRICTACPFDY